MFELKQLYEDRAEIAKSIRRLADLHADEGHTWSAEDQENWSKANEDYNGLTRKIQVEETARKIERDQCSKRDQEIPRDSGGKVKEEREREEREDRQEGRPRSYLPRPISIEDQCLALQAWCRSQAGIDLSDEHRAACRRAGVNPGVKEFTVSLRREPYERIRQEFRAQSVGTDSAGGFLVPTGFVNELERSMLAFGGMRQVSSVIRTASGNDLPWPTVNDTGNSGAILAENAQDAEQAVTFGATTLQAFKYTSKIVLVSVELLQDSAFDLATELGRMLGERIARILNTHFTTGDGSSKPRGVVTAAGTGKTTASGQTTSLLAEDLIDLFHSVDPAYRENAIFMCHDNIAAVVRKIRERTDLTPDGGNFMWQPGLQAGQPDRLLGRPMIINQAMSSTITASDKVMAFGDFSKYKIRDVASVRLRRLVERYADYDQEAFVAFSRHDGDLLDAGTDPVKLLVMAAS